LEDGKKAWTNGQYITLDGEVTVDKLNVRKGPAITYDIVDTKEKEDKVKIVNSDENGWYEIELSDGETGFICGKYIETEAENKHDYSDLYNTNKDTSKSTSSSKSSVKAKSTKSSTKSKKSSSNVVSTMTVSATAYAGDSITATGTTPKVGRTIAVDPSIIPYGTRVYIPALGGTYVAEDCGGGIKGNRIDIFMGSESQCNSWGVRSIEIQILK
jgi:3D (Asp-Asp-Asp) domain-containing protein